MHRRSPEEIQEEVRHLEAIQPTPPPCPSWCAEAPGHRYDADAALPRPVYSRLHQDEAEELWQVETNIDGAVTFSELVGTVRGPHVDTRAIDEIEVTSAEDAHFVAEAAVRVAAKLNRLLVGNAQ